MNLKIVKALELWSDLLDKSHDWLILSWKKKGYDKQIAFLKYKKYSEKAVKMAKKLAKLAKQYYE